MDKAERRSAILKGLAEKARASSAADLQCRAYLAQCPDSESPSRWDGFKAWEHMRGNSVSSFQASAEALVSEGLLERRNLLSGMYARFVYHLAD